MCLLQVTQAIRHKLIKVPIQPVNKLLSKVGRSQSSQHLTNLEIDENEQLTILKLFGTKFIEKTSTNIPPVISIENTDQSDEMLERRNSLSGIIFNISKFFFRKKSGYLYCSNQLSPICNYFVGFLNVLQKKGQTCIFKNITKLKFLN